MSDMLGRYKILLAIGIVIAVVGMVIFYLYKFGHKQFLLKRGKTQLSIPQHEIRKEVLDNGMTVLVLPLKSSPKVWLQVAYDFGSGVEASGERGMAHIVEHMIFKGTKRLSEVDLDEITRKYGATNNAETSQDITTYYFETNKSNWKPFIDIMADCMQNARFDEQHLASEMKAVIQELKMYNDDYWYKMSEKIDSLLYPAHHPYHHPIIGYREDLATITAEKVKAFYDKYYQPNRATLFVVGDVDPDEVILEVKEKFGSIVSTHEVEPMRYPSLGFDLTTHDTHIYEDVVTEQVCFYWRIPGMQDSSALVSSAAAFLLGAGEGSRLYRALVDDHKVATSVEVHAEKNLAAGVFLIAIDPIAGTIEECKRVIREELLKAMNNGFSLEELEHMIKIQGKHFVQRLQNFDSFAEEWVASYFATRDEHDVFTRLNRLTNITTHDIQSFMKEYLDPQFMNQMQVLPVPEEKRTLNHRAQKHIEERDEAILDRFIRTEPVEQPKYVLQMPDPEPLNFDFPKPDRTFTLNNGLSVVLKQKRSLPIVNVRFKFKNFSYLLAAKEGIAVDVMMESLIEESQGFKKQDVIEFFKFYGVDYDFSETGARLSCLSSDVQSVFERFIHILTKPIFTEDILKKLQTLSVDSYERDKDDALEVAHRELKKHIYKGHPFSWDYDQAVALIRSLTVADMQQLHKKTVAPNNMVVSVVGDFDLDEMEHLVRQLCTSWEPVVVKEKTEHQSSFTPGKQYDIQMVRDQMVVLFGRPSEITIYHEDLVPLKLLNYIAFYDAGSRLFRLREETGLFYTAFGGWAVGAGKEHGLDFIGFLLNNENVSYAQKKVEALLMDFATKGVTEEELCAARNLYRRAIIDGVSTNGGIAETFCMLEVFNLGFDYYDTVLKRIQKLTKEELDKLCASYFTMDGMITVRVGRVK